MHKATKLMMTMSMYLIKYLTRKLIKTNQNTRIRVVMVLIKENNKENIMRETSCLDLVEKTSEASLTAQNFLVSS